ncbi:hypothetical protein OOK29_09790 [Streptomyces phaeochromogenes]|uniref:hypothetical protein n=1 Tax=Streptomyces phaeochromogenes TaxID=1923 RepID=UPI0022581595|nr:hypothetical protein [Streptomyces phaeochromogenes]MCX5598429.1 hypothetical protein [Streptomyces phaeochromogenes]
MARLWTCGFELQSATEWQTTNGTPAISTTVKRSGAAALRCNPTAAVAGVAHTLYSTGQTAGRFFLRAYVRVAAYPSARTAIMGWADNTTGTTGFMCIKMNNDGTLIAGGSGATTGTASAALALDTWYRVELDYDDTANSINAYLNGALWTTVTAVDLGGGNIARFGVLQTATADLYFDDLAVNDTTGSTQTGLPGPGNIYHLRPNAAGDSNGYATAVGGTAGAANNYTRVNETPPNDATSYNQTTATGTTTTDDFNLDSSATAGIGAGERVTLVAVGGRIGSNAATAASLVYRIKSQTAGTVLESASVSVALNGWATHKAASPFPYQLTSYTDPQAGGAWTQALLDTAQIGYRSNVSQTTARRVSALWALAETVPVTTVALGVAAETGTARPVTTAKVFAVGTATETAAAQHVGRPIAQITDGFDDDVDPVKWSNSFGTYSAVGGRGRVACDTGYNAISSALTYTLHESELTLQAFAPAAGGATAEAWSQILIKSITGGTDLGFELRMTTGELVAFSRVGYFDGAAVYETYSPTDHAWLRVREAGGTTYWDASPDGSTWTNLRSATSPTWAGDLDLELQLIAHRSDGTPDYAEFDNVNLPPGGLSVELGVAEESAAGQTLTARKTLTAGLASSTNGAQPVGVRKATALSPALETSTGQALGLRKSLPVALAAESGTAQAVGRGKTLTLAAADETGASQALGRSKTRSAGAGAESDLAQPLAVAKHQALTAPDAAEQAVPVGRAKARSAGHAAEQGGAVAVGYVRTVHLTTGAEDAAAGSILGGKSRPVLPAGEVAEAQALSPAKTAPLGAALGSGDAQSVAVAKQVSVSAAAGSETAGGIARAKRVAAGAAVVVEGAQPVGGAKAAALSVAFEDAAAQTAFSRKTAVLSESGETGAGRSLAVNKTAGCQPAAEAGQAQPLTTARVYALAATVEAGQAQQIAFAGTMATAVETGEAQAVGKAKTLTLQVAVESTQATPLAGAKSVALQVAADGEDAQSVASRKARLLGLAAEVGAARVLTQSATSNIDLAAVLEAARPLIGMKRIVLEPAAEIGGGLGATARKRRSLTAAMETGTASVVAVPDGSEDIDVTVGAPYLAWSTGSPRTTPYASKPPASSWPTGILRGSPYRSEAPVDEWEVADL